MQLSSDMEIVELDDFEPAFTFDRNAEASVRRRYMTLFVPDDQAPAYGGCGYVARACNVKGEVFALKRMSPVEHIVDPEIAARATAGRIAAFKEEYANQLVLSQLKGFPQLFGYGTVDGQPCILMEWIEGVSLKDAAAQLPHAAGGAVSAEAVADVGISVLQVLEGIDRLRKRLVHRDISPSNIMIRVDRTPLAEQVEKGEYDVCLIDFGSSSVEDLDASDPSFTQMSGFWRNGTPEYAPPEMLTRDVPELADKRQSPLIDVYALSSVLYELYSGRTPFRVASYPSDISPYRIKTEHRPDPLAPSADEQPLADALMEGLNAQQALRPDAKRLMEELLSWRCGDSAEAKRRCEQASALAAAPVRAVHDSDAAPERLVMTSRAAGGARASHASEETVPMKAASAPSPVHKPGRVALAVAGAAIAMVSVATLASGLSGGVDNSAETDSRSVSQQAQSQTSGPATVATNLASMSASQTALSAPGMKLACAQDAETGRWGFIDGAGEWAVQPIYENALGSYSGASQTGLFAAQNASEQKWGLVNIANLQSWAVSPGFANIGAFSAASVDGGDAGRALAPAIDSVTGRAGYIDASGAWAIAPNLLSAHQFIGGFAAAQASDGSWGVLNQSGTWAVQPAYQDVDTDPQDPAEQGFAFKKGTAKWDFVLADGTAILSDVTAKTARPFAQGLAAYSDGISELWGFVDTDGDVAINPAFSNAYGFCEGVAPAQDAASGLWGLVGTSGAWKVTPAWKSMRGFSYMEKPDGTRVAVARAQDASTDLWGFVDVGGRWSVQPAYSSLQAYWA